MSARRDTGGGKGTLMLALVLGLCALGTGVAVVYVKYLTRMEFGVLQQVRVERDALDVQWGQLQIEEAALTSHTRVEDNARRKLDMYLPQGGEVRVVELAPSGRNHAQ
jgi:cell division protein FtsL